MGAPQFLQRPRNTSHVTSGMFRYHGMEYLQCGQCDFGVTMLMPDGNRWMHTFKKLPTMQPRAKKTSDQKWNGTSDQLCALKIASMPINTWFQGAAHHIERHAVSSPDFKSRCALMQQHAQAVGRTATGGFGRFEQRSFRRIVNHVVNRPRLDRKST